MHSKEVGSHYYCLLIVEADNILGLYLDELIAFQ